MKRSEINLLINDSIAFFDEMKFKLPRWGHWGLQDWKINKQKAGEIIENMLGWDLTDFGAGNFEQKGLVLFTLRNGNFHRPDSSKCYAEKVMIVREKQETPLHFHWSKMEDIINRGGGNLALELYGSTEDEQLSDQPVTVKVDAIEKTVAPGGRIVLAPGESICLEPHLFHRFFGEEGKGKVLVGEVSAVNDDAADNRFYDSIGRFPEIDEDEEPLHLLVNDYQTFL